MSIELPTTEYGPEFPNKEQTLEVFKEFGQDAEESKTAVKLWIDGRHTEADLSGVKINRLLVDVKTGILFIEAGFHQLAIDCYDAVCDVIENDESLTPEDQNRLVEENEELGNKISLYFNASDGR